MPFDDESVAKNTRPFFSLFIAGEEIFNQFPPLIQSTKWCSNPQGNVKILRHYVVHTSALIDYRISHYGKPPTNGLYCPLWLDIFIYLTTV